MSEYPMLDEKLKEFLQKLQKIEDALEKALILSGDARCEKLFNIQKELEHLLKECKESLQELLDLANDLPHKNQKNLPSANMIKDQFQRLIDKIKKLWEKVKDYKDTYCANWKPGNIDTEKQKKSQKKDKGKKNKSVYDFCPVCQTEFDDDEQDLLRKNGKIICSKCGNEIHTQ